jgi:hypothetical protein
MQLVQKSFWVHLMELLGDVGQVEARFVLFCFEIVLISMQDRCMVCADFTTGMKIFLGTLDGSSR